MKLSGDLIDVIKDVVDLFKMDVFDLYKSEEIEKAINQCFKN